MKSKMLKTNFLYHSFLSDNNLLSPKFRSGDSCINQLLSINNEILNAFDKGLESMTWCLIFKQRQNGISGDIINILQDFLHNRKQRVVLNGHCSSWVYVSTVVPQGSILGPLLFVIYINGLSDGLKSELNYLLMILLCFPWFMIIILQRVILMRT